MKSTPPAVHGVELASRSQPTPEPVRNQPDEKAGEIATDRPNPRVVKSLKAPAVCLLHCYQRLARLAFWCWFGFTAQDFLPETDCAETSQSLCRRLPPRPWSLRAPTYWRACHVG